MLRVILLKILLLQVCDECLVQVGYAIGVAEPMGIYLNTYGTSKVNLSDAEIAEKIVESIFDMRPYFIEKRLKLRNQFILKLHRTVIWEEIPKQLPRNFKTNGNVKEKEVELFTWEGLDYIDKNKKI